MSTLCNLGSTGSVQSLHAWALEHLISSGGAARDFRSAMAALASNLFTAAANTWVKRIACQALKGARFAQRMTAADTMVAAGGR